MQTTYRSAFPVQRITPLPACLAAAFALAAPGAMATNRVVLNCNDSGSGSLRDIVTNVALDLDTVDLSQLACSTITLITGEIDVPVNNLTLTAGPGANSAVTIDGGFSAGHHNRVLIHTGTGKLILHGLTITDTKYNSGVLFEGGCILSVGEVDLIGSTVSHCSIFGSAANNSNVRGGAIYAAHDVHLLASTVTGNFASAAGTNLARGGGIYSRFGNIVATYSTVSHNTAVAAAIQSAEGGGIFSRYIINLGYSTISDNQAQVGGGIHLTAGSSYLSVITNSTISGNNSSDQFQSGGGMYINAPLTLSNSTVAFNTSASANGVGGLYGTTVDIQSSIIADNKAGGAPRDLFATTLTGADNLIYHSVVNLASLTNTISGQCPKLAPLADNGATPQTHALHVTSPAIDKGNNSLGLTADERGDPFHRTVGIAADIGAYEWQGGPIDSIFRSRFESGCDE